MFDSVTRRLRPGHSARLVPWLWFAVVTLGVMLPLLRPGFVLTLDMVFTPKLPAPDGVSNLYLFRGLLHVLNFVLPGQVIEKLLMSAILFFTGLGMYHLVRTKSEFARYFAGIFYMINPFTYERWISGQYLVLTGYMLLPWVIRAGNEFCRAPRKRTALPVALWLCLIAALSIHFVVLAALAVGLLFVAHLLVQSPKGSYYRDMWRGGGFIVLVLLVLNSYWLYGVVRGSSAITQTLDGISGRDFTAFTTTPGPHGLLFNVLSLYGFWLERFGRYAMPNTNRVVLFGGFGLILILVVVGIRQLRRQRSLLALCIGLLAVSGFVMALGVQAPVTGGLVRAIVNHVPLMRGFREPEKFSALLVLGYVFFAAYGLDGLLAKVPSGREGRLELLRDSALILPFVYTSTMPLGFANQLRPVSYPASWYSFNQQLQRNPPTGKLLFLPWHEYMSYDFSRRVIASPAADFFTAGQVIAGTDAELNGIDDSVPTPTSRFVAEHVLDPKAHAQVATALTKIHVQYVLLASGYDVAKYAWLAQQPHLHIISRQPGLVVFRNEAYHG